MSNPYDPRPHAVKRQLTAMQEAMEAENLKLLKNKLGVLRRNGAIGAKLQEGAYLLIAGNFARSGKMRDYAITEISLYDRHNRPNIDEESGLLIPSKMIVYRELARLGFKWNNNTKQWEEISGIQPV